MAPPPFRNHRLRPSAVRHGQAAFSLVELLVAVVLGSVVLGALGGALLVSEMRVSTNIRKDLEKKDALNRAMALMRQEISSAGKISINPPNAPAAGPCSRPALYLWRAPNMRICYKPMPSQDISQIAYPSDRPWTGPCVLVREGPPYRPDGELSTSGERIVQVLVDNLVACDTVTDAMDMQVTNVGPVPMRSTSRDVDVTINQTDGIATSFSARIASNPLYAGMDMYGDTACPSGGTICYENPASNFKHWRPSMLTTGGSNVTATSLSGDADKENVFYFDYPQKDYTLQETATSTNPCTYKNCFVERTGTPASVQLTNADVLVFADGESRP